MVQILALFFLLTGSLTGGYALYLRTDQNNLTGALKAAVDKADISTAQHTADMLQRRGYTSPAIASLKKRLAVLHGQARAWDSAQDLYRAGMFVQASGALSAFTSDALYREKAYGLLESIRNEQLHAMLQTATAMYAGGALKDAGALAQEVLKQDPGNHGALDLLSMIHLRGTPPASRQSVVRKDSGHARIRDDGDDAYKRCDLGTAIHRWTASHSPSGARKIVLAGDIRKYLALGKSAYARHDYPAAAACFDKARTFIGLLHIGGSACESLVREQCAHSYNVLGQEALSKHAFRQANTYFGKSLDCAPANHGALSGFSALNEKAEALYKKAYVLWGANKPAACGLYRQAAAIAQKDSDVYKKSTKISTACRPR